jgi:hypothetical protein
VVGCLLFGAQDRRNGRAGFAYSSWFGLLFSLLYLTTGDLIAVTIAHALGNILAVVLWAPRIERSRRAAAPRRRRSSSDDAAVSHDVSPPRSVRHRTADRRAKAPRTYSVHPPRRSPPHRAPSPHAPARTSAIRRRSSV